MASNWSLVDTPETKDMSFAESFEDLKIWQGPAEPTVTGGGWRVAGNGVLSEVFTRH